MGFLTDYEEKGLTWRGRFYRVNPAFDIVLNMERMFREKSILTYPDKLDIALKLLTGGRPEGLTSLDREALFGQICERFLSIKPRPKVGKQLKLMDFEEDGEYLYASFLQAYGIDLIKQQGKLPWRRFIALFQGLPEGTVMREIMRIRGAEIPKPDRYNQNEIRNLMELKAYYTLPQEEGTSRLDNLFATLEKMMEQQGKEGDAHE